MLKLRFVRLGLFIALSFILIDGNAQGDGVWRLINGPGFRDVNAISLLDNGDWFGAGGNLQNDPISSILLSEDGGNYWRFRLDAVNAQLTDVVFISDSVGVAAGWAGSVYRSEDGGDSWAKIELQGNLAHRNYNALCLINETTLFAAGGNVSNDSIQTIMRSDDGGLTWSIVRDALAPILYDMEMLDQNNGFAVGGHSTIVKTVDGGSNWTEIAAPGSIGNRDFRDIHFKDNEAWIVGGIPGIDSVQTVLRSYDGGDSWASEWDSIGPMLYGIDFIEQKGFVAGDNGVIYYTSNKGDDWSQVVLDEEINDELRGLRDVVWADTGFAMLVGAQGKILRYEIAEGAKPIVETSGAMVINLNSINFSGRVNPQGFEAMAVFEYGTDPENLTDAIVADQNPVNGTELQDVSAVLSGIDPEATYYYRAVASNQNGTVIGTTRFVYAGDNPIPNWDFEIWDSVTNVKPNVWGTFGNNQIVESYNGTNALKMQGVDEASAGIIFQGSVGQMGPEGYIHFPYKPDSLTGYFNYIVQEGDVARIWLQLADNTGEKLVDTIYTLTGSSNGEWTRLSLPIEYDTDGMPDSLFILLSSSDFFASPNSESVVVVDDLIFSGADPSAVPNGDFEDVTQETLLTPVNWYTGRPMSDEISSQVLRSSNSQHGNFALHLRNTDQDNGKVSLNMQADNQIPAFPIHYTFETFTGYYWFKPVEDSDSLRIWINMFQDGVEVGSGLATVGGENTEYQRFDIDIEYWIDPVEPDSANIQINLFSFEGRTSAYALIDNLSFDGVVSSTKKSMVQTKMLEVFPNPADDKITIRIPNANAGSAELEIYSISGQPVLKRHVDDLNNELSVDTKSLSPGTYIATLRYSNGVHVGLFVVI